MPTPNANAEPIVVLYNIYILQYICNRRCRKLTPEEKHQPPLLQFLPASKRARKGKKKTAPSSSLAAAHCSHTRTYYIQYGMWSVNDSQNTTTLHPEKDHHLLCTVHTSRLSRGPAPPRSPPRPSWKEILLPRDAVMARPGIHSTRPRFTTLLRRVESSVVSVCTGYKGDGH